MNDVAGMSLHKRLYWAALIYLMGKQTRVHGEPSKKQQKRNDLNGIYFPIGGGDTIEITSSSTAKDIRKLKWLMFRNNVYLAWCRLCAKTDRVFGVVRDARRYYKLRDLMTRNVQPTWEQVERIAATGAWVDWNAFDDYLDGTNVDYLHAQSKPYDL